MSYGKPVKSPQFWKNKLRVNVYGKKSFLSKESDTLRSYRVYSGFYKGWKWLDYYQFTESYLWLRKN